MSEDNRWLNGELLKIRRMVDDARGEYANGNDEIAIENMLEILDVVRGIEIEYPYDLDKPEQSAAE